MNSCPNLNALSPPKETPLSGELGAERGVSAVFEIDSNLPIFHIPSCTRPLANVKVPIPWR